MIEMKREVVSFLRSSDGAFFDMRAICMNFLLYLHQIFRCSDCVFELLTYFVGEVGERLLILYILIAIGAMIILGNKIRR